MRFEVDRRALEAGLSRAMGAVSPKTTMPILSNVLFDFDGTSLKIAATDLELSIETKVHARGVDAGKTTIPAKKLSDIIRNLSCDILSFELSDPNMRLLIKAGKARFEIPVIPADDYPTLLAGLTDAAAKVDLFHLATALERIDHAIPAKSDTYTVPGVFLHLVDGYYRFVASDGYQLSYAQFSIDKVDNRLEVGDGIVIPGDTAKEIIRLQDKGKNAASRIEITERSIRVEYSDTSLSSLLMESQFPEYGAVIPEKFEQTIKIPREEFGAALKRLSALTKSVYVYVSMVIAPGSLTMQTGGGDEGTAYDQIQIDYDGPEFRVAFKLDYVRNIVAASPSEILEFSWVDSFHGGVFTDSGNQDVLYFIMPMVV